MRIRETRSLIVAIGLMTCLGCGDDATSSGGSGGVAGGMGGAGGEAGSVGGNGGTGGGLPTACTDRPDLDLVSARDFDSDYAVCAGRSLGNPGETSDCLQEDVGLSEGCSECYGTYAGCFEFDCDSCNPLDAACENCIITECSQPFAECAGFRFPSP